jgi:hypothetical protein
VLDEDLHALVAAAEGLPGRAIWFAEALQHERAWQGGRPRCSWLRTEAAIWASETYRRHIQEIERPAARS